MIRLRLVTAIVLAAFCAAVAMADICDPIPEPPYTGEGEPTLAGENCRGDAYGDYLEALFLCWVSPIPDPQCCSDAKTALMHALAMCPD